MPSGWYSSAPRWYGTLVPERIVAFAGSLRRGSYNRALITAAQQVAPGDLTIETIEIGNLPFYNADVEQAGDPASVAARGCRAAHPWRENPWR